ncbi:MAG: hypothetical protein QOJ89_3699 [bacterium]|jgi:hypothetical protein
MKPINTDCESWIGSTLIDGDDCKVGTIEEVYFDEQTDRPQWMVVKTGLLGSRHSFVPLASARLAGDVVETPYDKRQIVDAPRVDTADDLPDDQVVELYRYYALPYCDPVDGSAPGGSLAERILSYLG